MRVLSLIALCLLLGTEVPSPYEYVVVRAHDRISDYTSRELTASPGAIRQEIVAYPTDRAPKIDGRLDPVWENARPVTVPLFRKGPDTAKPVRMMLYAMYDEEQLYLLARWPETKPIATGGDMNKLTVHWSVVPEFVHCSVACHTAYVDPQGTVRVLNAETIPQVGHESLPAAGGCQDGAWTVEWSRPLRSDNPYDLQMVDLDIDYPFRVKVFEHQPGQPDPMSDLVSLRFH